MIKSISLTSMAFILSSVSALADQAGCFQLQTPRREIVCPRERVKVNGIGAEFLRITPIGKATVKYDGNTTPSFVDPNQIEAKGAYCAANVCKREQAKLSNANQVFYGEVTDAFTDGTITLVSATGVQSSDFAQNVSRSIQQYEKFKVGDPVVAVISGATSYSGNISWLYTDGTAYISTSNGSGFSANVSQLGHLAIGPTIPTPPAPPILNGDENSDVTN